MKGNGQSRQLSASLRRARYKRFPFLAGKQPVSPGLIRSQREADLAPNRSPLLNFRNQCESQIVPEPAATASTVAAFMGLRHGEIQNMLWENYHDGEMYMSRSIWNGRTTNPKTRKGRAPVPMIRQLAERLEMHRLRCGNPQTGPFFPTATGKPLPLGNVAKPGILPALNRCAACKKSESDHRKADHEFERDASIPEWHGWHAARRGLGSNLCRLGAPGMVIQRILRHASANTTATYYV